MNFQDIIFELNQYWADQGCIIQQPYDIEKSLFGISFEGNILTPNDF